MATSIEVNEMDDATYHAHMIALRNKILEPTSGCAPRLAMHAIMEAIGQIVDFVADGSPTKAIQLIDHILDLLNELRDRYVARCKQQ
jgi:hypothetical protein